MNTKFHTNSYFCYNFIYKKCIVIGLLILMAISAMSCIKEKSNFEPNGKKPDTFVNSNGQKISAEPVQIQNNKSNSEIELTQDTGRIIELTNPRMEGNDVLSLQRRLLSLGFTETGEADGYYGPLTAGVIKNVQILFGFEADGKVNKSLWDNIFGDKIVLLVLRNNLSRILENKDDILLQNVNTVLTYDRKDLEKSRNFFEYHSFSDAIAEAYAYYSLMDKKVKIFEHKSGGGESGGSIYDTEIYYFINNECYFINYNRIWHTIYEGDGEENEMYFVNDNKCFQIVNGELINFNRNNYDYWKANTINSFLHVLNTNSILGEIIEEDGTVTFEYTENEFTINGKGAITAYNGNLESLTIPDQICGIQVTSIGDGVFQNKNISSVILPEGLTSIGLDTFIGNQLKNIIIPSNVTFIGVGAFWDNDLLINITIGADVILGLNLFLQPNVFSYDFGNFYNANGKKTGTYEWNGKIRGVYDGQWSFK